MTSFLQSMVRASLSRKDQAVTTALRRYILPKTPIWASASSRWIATATRIRYTEAKGINSAATVAGREQLETKKNSIPKRKAVSKPSLRRAAREVNASRLRHASRESHVAEEENAEKVCIWDPSLLALGSQVRRSLLSVALRSTI
jgi:hypothetical protein